MIRKFTLKLFKKGKPGGGGGGALITWKHIKYFFRFSKCPYRILANNCWKNLPLLFFFTNIDLEVASYHDGVMDADDLTLSNFF